MVKEIDAILKTLIDTTRDLGKELASASETFLTIADQMEDSLNPTPNFEETDDVPF